MVTTTNLLHDMEEYFADHNVGPERYPRLHHISLLRRAYELIIDQDDKIHALAHEERTIKKCFSDCSCWRELDDNDDS
jgi:hypothetical protein